ncbi:glucose-6-phosphate dehydrogenase assembly protein OpcA [Dactylosporangium sp. AC04546]|uniref:glucose-6-phosphate dehydrogenase assembly protein OpcA n=1 Tax=Dactylosporangium sp. AC04546 TaxID=2862460 RepID=UPI001EDF5201|nr:glucose-6-phosphate dehydrogenase assembly protein OpcA [Dactylosporangium sp. AC04546]WVK85588.1 glucose-6-phosphate dehydrogenase assembly protein OpcA [Dactylosporangium sp. AC04546]
MIGLWDTTGIEVVKALANERRSAGGLTSGLALTLIAVVDERQVREAEAAATIAAAQHPCRLLIIVRADVTQQRSRLDAEIVVGGRLGPCEAVVMRMQGRLALHAESVVMPLLAPDVPVVTWWQCTPPERIAYDPLGVVADRRITDSAQADDPVEALRIRADDYVPGDTDLAWSRITPWRTLLAGAFDANRVGVRAVNIVAPDKDPTAPLLGGWLEARLGVHPTRSRGSGKIMEAVELQLEDDTTMRLVRDLNAGVATLQCTGQPDRILPLSRRPLGEELAEELRRLDPDQPYAAALAAATGKGRLDERLAPRVHIWKDPALAERPEAAPPAPSLQETLSS